ncbi:MAG TPA: hypothetical protein VIV12_25825 [Streptosporangiaceae bacterium]
MQNRTQHSGQSGRVTVIPPEDPAEVRERAGYRPSGCWNHPISRRPSQFTQLQNARGAGAPWVEE